MSNDDKHYRDRSTSRPLGLLGCLQIGFYLMAAFFLTCLCGAMRGSTNHSVGSPRGDAVHSNDAGKASLESAQHEIPPSAEDEIWIRPRQLVEPTAKTTRPKYSQLPSVNTSSANLIQTQQPRAAQTSQERYQSALKCYTWPSNKSSHIELLPDIELDSGKLVNGSNIFFHDTSCLTGLVKLNARQACSIESAARSNPHMQIWTLFTSLVGFDKHVEHSPIMKALEAYPNINLRNLNIWKYPEGTPAEEWIKQPDLLESRFLFEHIADFLRLVSLYKFGGTYFDMDFIVMQSLSDEPPNFAGIETTNNLSNGVLNFDYDGIGHFIVDKILREFIAKFNGKNWAINGPLLITRMIQDICRTPELVHCTIFKAHEQSVFYPIFYGNWHNFFQPNATEDVIGKVINSKAVHMWNKLTAKEPIRIGEYTAYELLAQEFCPRVYNAIKADMEF